MSFRQKMLLALIPVVGALIGLLTAIVTHVPSPSPTPAPTTPPSWTSPNVPSPPTSIFTRPAPSPLSGDPPYFNAQGERIDQNGEPCGNGQYGHSYNGAQECWFP